MLSAGAALARGPAGGRPDFATLDADQNREISLTELEAHRAERFAKNDSYSDGVLEREEPLARSQEQVNARAREFDRAATRALIDQQTAVLETVQKAMLEGGLDV